MPLPKPPMRQAVSHHHLHHSDLISLSCIRQGVHAQTSSVLSPPHRGVFAPLYAQILAFLSLFGGTYYPNCVLGSHLHWLACSQLGVGLPSGPGPLPLDWLAQGCPLVVKQVLGWVWRSSASGPPWDMRWDGLQQCSLTPAPVHFHLLPCCLGG